MAYDSLKRPKLGTPLTDFPSGEGGSPTSQRDALIAASAAANPGTVPVADGTPVYKPVYAQRQIARPLRPTDMNVKSVSGAPFAGLGYRPGVDKGQVVVNESYLTNPQTPRPLARPGATPTPASTAASPAVGAPAVDPRIQPVNSPGSAVPTTVASRLGVTQRPDGVAVKPYITPDGQQANAYAASGASVAAALQRNPGAAQANTVNGQNFGTGGLGATPNLVRADAGATLPSFGGGQTNLRGDTRGAEAQRTAIDKQLADIIAGTSLNSRGKRQFVADLTGQRASLANARGNDASGLASAAANIVGQGDEAALAANARMAEGGAQLGFNAQENALKRAFDYSTSGDTVVGADGNLALVRAGQATPVTGPDGQPFKAGGASLSAKDALGAYADQLASLDDLSDPDGAQRAQVRAAMDALIGGGAAPAATAPPAVGTVQNGYRFKGGDPGKKENWEKQ